LVGVCSACVYLTRTKGHSSQLFRTFVRWNPDALLYYRPTYASLTYSVLHILVTLSPFKF